MNKSPFAEIDNSILKWARESSGLNLDSASRKVGTSAHIMKSWEDGAAFPTIKQLRKIAKAYMRPIAMFFLDELPEEPEKIKDFRHLPDVLQEKMSPALRFEIRLAYDRREEALDLASDLAEELGIINLAVSLSDGTEQAAGRIRSALGVSTGEQFKWRSKRDAFNAWRKALENLGVLIFQTGILRNLVVPLDETRGFSISDQPFPVIVVNGNDHASAKCFTLIHEFCHILLHEGGLCDLHNPFVSKNDSESIEIFCNQIAGSVLVPKDELLKNEVVRYHGQNPEWGDDELSTLSRKFWVSWEVVLRRLLVLNKTTRGFYRTWREGRPDRYPGTDDHGEVKISTATRVTVRNGKLLPRLVLTALRNGQITTFEASEILGAGPDHMSDVEHVIF
jgi:Zn-dependent peptidase ImmA (M78 family)